GRLIVYFLAFSYFGHCLSYLNGYYLHYGGNPNVPLAWGVSSYHKLYNSIWFNNGYHAEHHYRPRVHWTDMKQLHEQLRDEQARAGTRVIAVPHALGFLEPSPRPVPERPAGRRAASDTRWPSRPAWHRTANRAH